MAKFNLKEHIAKNKATFFSSLTEGQFSWMTQDTGQQIGSQEENTIPVYMFDNNGKYYYEKNYDGYGVFGGKDYYELLDQMNGGIGDRSEGIRKAFDKPAVTAGEVLFPALVTDPYKFNYKTHDFTQEAETDPNQSWYEPEEDDDYIMGNDDEYDNRYGDEDEDLDENMNKDASSIAEKFAQYMSKKEGKKFSVTPGSVDEKSFDLDVDGIEYEGGSYLIKDNGDIVNVAITPNEVYGNINQLEEGEAAYEYEKGKEAGEKIEKTKMKKSELKAKIKEMIIAEMDGPAVEDSQYDFLKEIEEMLDEAEGLTPLQDYVYQYEIEISGEDQAQEFLDDIKKLNTPDDVYDYYAYGRDWQGSMDDDLENIYRQVKRKFKNLSEADEDTTDAEAAADAGAEDTEVTDTEVTTDVTTDEVDPNVKAVQDALTQAQAAAQQLGDKKLMDQIGNTITFFTRAHVVEKPKGAVVEGDLMQNIGKGLEYETTEEMIRDYADRLLGAGVDDVEDLANYYLNNPEELPEPMEYEFFKNNYDDILSLAMTGLDEGKKEDLNESMFPNVKENIKETLLLQKRAGIITEAQYKQKLNEASEDEVPLTPKVKKFIDKTIADSKKDGEFENLKEVDWFENELIDELIDLFPNKDYDSASEEVMDYISQAIK